MTPRKRVQPRVAARSAARRKTALELRVEGLTLEAIGAKLGVSKQRAHQILAGELAEVATARKGLAEHQLEAELAAIDFVLRGMAPKVAKGDAKAGATYLRAMERRAKLLGLDAPDKHEHTVDVKKLSDADLDAEIARLTALAAGPGAPGAASAREDAADDGAGDPSG